MSYNFQNRLAYNATRMKQINSELVTYTREGVTTITNLVASPIIQKTEDFGQYGFMLSTDNQQWGLDVDDLGSLFPPKENDRIIRSNGEEFKAAKFSQSDTVYAPTTSSRIRIILNTRRSKVAS